MELFAQPYDTSANGFSFEDEDEFAEKYQENLPVEEYEISFLDGSDEEAEIFKVAGITAANLAEWFQGMNMVKDHMLPAVYFLLYNNTVSSFADAVDKADELSFRDGDVKEYAEAYIDDLGGPAELSKKTLEQYFDYDAFARDLRAGGDVTEFEFAGSTYTADPNSV